VAPLQAQPPLQATPPIHTTPPIYPTPAPLPLPAPPPPPAPAAAQPIDDFSFDFGETEGDRIGSFAAQPPSQRIAASSLLSSGESDEDLWSEVSLRGNTGDLLQGRTPAGSGVGPGADIVELKRETALDAPDVLFEDDDMFEEAATAAPETLSSPAATVPMTPCAPAPPISIDPAEIERIVASRVEAAVRKALEPIIGDQARAVIEAVAWEVIPDLAEAMIRAEIERVRQSTRTD